ncbi:MAG: trigger factor [Herbinix sp.]|jgi:trigger factor|nr:trigger factor [Herbinix sp.]
MKKKVLFLVMSLSILMLAGGCSKKDVANEPNGTENTATQAPEATVAPTDETATEVAPVREAYEVGDYITLGEYKGIEVTVDKLEVKEEDIDAAIQTDLQANTTQEEVTDRAIESGDIVNIDYEGLKDGVAFEGGSAQAYDLTIGSGQFIPGFEDQLIGAKTGDKLALDITFPADYTAADLAGQAVVFNVTVNSIKKAVVPELTEEYVKANTDYDTIAAYREGTRAKLQTENEDTMKNNKINSILTSIIDNSEISSYPQTLLDYYSYEMKDYYTQYAKMYGMEFADFLSASGMTEESFTTQQKSYAEDRASQELALNAIIKAEKIELTDDEYKAGVAKILTDYGYASEDELFKSATEAQIKESLIWEKAVNFVTEQAVEL